LIPIFSITCVLLQAWGGNRALCHRPSLLLLDEATSALDIATEAKLFEALRAALRTNSRSSWRPTASALLPAVIKWLI
jgi:ABC-type taurine transport system ATPase subunit